MARASPTCLGLPDGQRRPCDGRKHVSAARHLHGQHLARHIVFLAMVCRGVPVAVIFVWCCWCCRCCTVVGHTRRALLSGALLGGREHRRRGDGPIRHGLLLSQLDAAFGRAHLTVRNRVGRSQSEAWNCRSGGWEWLWRRGGASPQLPGYLRASLQAATQALVHGI